MVNVWNLLDEGGCWVLASLSFLMIGRWKLWEVSLQDCKGGGCVGKRTMRDDVHS